MDVVAALTSSSEMWACQGRLFLPAMCAANGSHSRSSASVCLSRSAILSTCAFSVDHERGSFDRWAKFVLMDDLVEVLI